MPIPPGTTEPEGTWTIPQPGELGPADVLAAGVALWARHWRLLALLSLLLYGSVLIVQALLEPGPNLRELIEWFREGAPEPIPQASPRAQALGTLGGLILSPILLLATLRILLGGTVGSVPGPSRAIGYGLRRLPSTLWLLVAIVITGVGIFLGAGVVGLILAAGPDLLAIAAIALVVYPVVRLAVAVPTLVVDDTRGFKALGRAWELTRGRWWHTFSVLLVFGLIASVAGLLMLVLPALGPSGTAGDLAQAIMTAVIGAFTGPLGAGILAVLYLDLRARHHRDGAGAVRELIERHDPPSAQM